MKKMIPLFAWLVLLFAMLTVQAAEITLVVDGTNTLLRTAPLQIETNETGLLAFSGGDSLSPSGAPDIPWKTVRVLLPPDADLRTISCQTSNVIYQPFGSGFSFAPVPPMLTRNEAGEEVEFWPSGARIEEGRDLNIYGQDAFWPKDAANLLGNGQIGNWKIVELGIPLVRINPISGAVEILQEMTLAVDFSPLRRAASASSSESLVGAWSQFLSGAWRKSSSDGSSCWGDSLISTDTGIPSRSAFSGFLTKTRI